MPEMRTRLGALLLSGVLLAGVLPVAAQDATAAAAKPVSFSGTVQTVSGSTLSVKSDAGVTMQVTVEESARLLRIEPGQKTLAGASPFSLTDLQAGDRVMARGATKADDGSLSATMLVAIKVADIAQKQERERAEWQKNGTGGLVKAVDSAASTVTVSLGASGQRTEVIHTSATTVVRRYAPGSVRFDQAIKGTLDQVKPGDQLRARGAKSADGATLEAEEIVSGSFRNLAGPVLAVDTTGSKLTVNDTVTKKPVIVAVTPDSEVKKLDPAVAQQLASRLGVGAGKRPNVPPGGAGPGSSAPPGMGGGPPAGSPPQGAGKRPDGPPGGAGPGSNPPPGMGGGLPAGSPPQGAGGAGQDMQQLLAHAPSITLKDLQKGNMVMIVATEGQAPGDATAITVVAGVEPMLQASTSESQAMLSSSWNLGGGAGGGEGSQ